MEQTSNFSAHYDLYYGQSPDTQTYDTLSTSLAPSSKSLDELLTIFQQSVHSSQGSPTPTQLINPHTPCAAAPQDLTSSLYTPYKYNAAYTQGLTPNLPYTSSHASHAVSNEPLATVCCSNGGSTNHNDLTSPEDELSPFNYQNFMNPYATDDRADVPELDPNNGKYDPWAFIMFPPDTPDTSQRLDDHNIDPSLAPVDDSDADTIIPDLEADDDDDEDDDDDSSSSSDDDSSDDRLTFEQVRWTPLHPAWWANDELTPLSKRETQFSIENKDYRTVYTQSKTLRFHVAPAYRRAKSWRGVQRTTEDLSRCVGHVSSASRRCRNTRLRLKELRVRELGQGVAELEEMFIGMTGMKEVMVMDQGEAAPSPVVRVGKMGGVGKARGGEFSQQKKKEMRQLGRGR